MTERRDPPASNVRDARLPALAPDALPARTPVRPVARAKKVAPPSLRVSDLDPLQVDVFAAMIATLPEHGPKRGQVMPFPKGERDG